MHTAHDIMQAFSKLDYKTLKKAMKETYGLDAPKQVYILNNIDSILTPESSITSKVNVYNLTQELQFKLHQKYFNATKHSICHNKSLDTSNFMNVLLYYDGIKELYDRLSDLIDVSLEETVFTFITASSEGYFDHLITKSVDHLKEIK